MKITFQYGLVGDEGTQREATAWLGDLIKAQRHFKKSSEELLASGDLEPLAFVLHSRLTFIAKRGEDPELVSVPPFNVFVLGEDEGTLAWLEPSELLANPTQPSGGSAS